MKPTPLLPALPLLACMAAAPITTQEARPASTRNVAILVFEGVELLDFSGPGEVFSAAHGPRGRAFRVYTVAKTKETVTSQGFLRVTPEFSITDCPAPDIVVLPGGNVPDEDRELQDWVRRCAQSSELVMSVCNGALLAGTAGLLDGLEATTRHGSLQSLARLVPKAKIHSNRRWVDSGRVLTCAGVSAGIDGALHVVERLLGAKVAKDVARYMEYDWRPDEIARLHAEPPRGADETEWTHLALAVEEKGLEQALVSFRALSEPPDETELNRAGYVLMNAGKSERAIALFRLVAAAFPESANASDSLSEAFERKGDAPLAIRNAEEALARLKKNTGLSQERVSLIRNACASRIARLGSGDKSALRYACQPCGNACDDLRYLEATRCPGCSMPLQESGAAPAKGE